ncbi:hypothetical protein [Bradyrhizobium sp. USDA 313]|uniref:hypothetical protein n=1 Tax=Bradyrhizobium sp. USDA 313 TaxID=3156307 RepID=UPI0035138828
MAHTQLGTVTAHFKGIDGLERTLIAPATCKAGMIVISADHRNEMVFAILAAGLLPSQVELQFVENEASRDARLAHERDRDLAEYAERLFNLEQSFADQKAEYQDALDDLRTEIDVRGMGIKYPEVAALVADRMSAVKALDEKAAHDANTALYEDLFGFSVETGDGNV